MRNLRADLNFPGVCDIAHGHALPRAFRRRLHSRRGRINCLDGSRFQNYFGIWATVPNREKVSKCLIQCPPELPIKKRHRDRR
jgi:hypothetical protein